jgi:uncharacterized membrane protein
MPKGRVESFSDCVIAFAITLLILDIHLQDVGTTTNSTEMINAIMALTPHFFDLRDKLPDLHSRVDRAP